ncbi:DUF4383 domain-containing protein [Actinosynnema sp. NPDC020468]|uniref:DUF4383 domain-containing protein n=1 Tax=Actinosynnema sp. NPDC020468 TaxID=3154488 RepID=UPI0033DB39A7
MATIPAVDVTDFDIRTPLQRGTAVAAVVFAVLGVLGFVPGLTQGLESIEFFGPASGAFLFGVFHVSVLLNLLYLAFGLVGALSARSVRGSALYLAGGSVLLVLLWVYGLMVAEDSSANVFPTDVPGNWLHLLLAIAMTGLCLVTAKRSLPPGAAPVEPEL